MMASSLRGRAAQPCTAASAGCTAKGEETFDGALYRYREWHQCGHQSRERRALPRKTRTLAGGALTAAGGHRMNAPAGLVVPIEGDTIGEFKTGDVWQQPELVFAPAFDGKDSGQV